MYATEYFYIVLKQQSIQPQPVPTIKKATIPDGVVKSKGDVVKTSSAHTAHTTTTTKKGKQKSTGHMRLLLHTYCKFHVCKCTRTMYALSSHFRSPRLPMRDKDNITPKEMKQS